MTDDLVEPLRAAIERADPNWLTQPSHLRRRLDEELAPNSRQYRAQVHQLVVAAEERVPVRLQRTGWSPAARAELVDVLVGTRGWTAEASEWAVVTWAAALDLTTERLPVPSVTARPRPSTEPVAATEVPTWSAHATDISDQDSADATLVGDEQGTDGEQPIRVGSDDTVLPDDRQPIQPAERPADVPATGAPAPSTPEPAPTGAQKNVVVRAVPTDDLPRRGTKAPTKRASRFLGQEIDVAYDVMAGPSPAWLLITLPILLAFFLVLSIVPLLPFLLVVLGGRALWPKRIVALSGSRVWLIRAKGFSPKPREVVAETTRDQIQFAGGFPPSIRIDGERLWFLMPSTSAARALPAPAEDAA